MIVLKQLQDLMQAANPERTYSLMDRNYEESYDTEIFRQVLSRAMIVGPDVCACHYVSESDTAKKIDYLSLLKSD